MYYREIRYDDLIIEFINSWTGKETVKVNRQIVSEKSSLLGTHHFFNVDEGGSKVPYVLTTRIGSKGVMLDLRKNGIIVLEDISVPFGKGASKPQDKIKRSAIPKIKEYNLEEGMEELKKALALDARDPEIYFYMACAYSVQEKPADGFECLKKAVQNKLDNSDIILEHDMLAYLRLHPAFEKFKESGFLEYDQGLLEEEE